MATDDRDWLAELRRDVAYTINVRPHDAERLFAEIDRLNEAADRMADILVDIINDPEATVPGPLLARAHLAVKQVRENER